MKKYRATINIGLTIERPDYLEAERYLSAIKGRIEDAINKSVGTSDVDFYVILEAIPE